MFRRTFKTNANHNMLSFIKFSKSSRHEKHIKMFVDVSESYDQSDRRDMAVDYPHIVSQKSLLSQSDPKIEDGPLSESNVSLHRNLVHFISYLL